MALDFSQQGVLDSVLEVFRLACMNGFTNLQPGAMALLGVLGIINICTTWTLYDGQLRLSRIIACIMKIGFFVYLITNMDKCTSWILTSFQNAGFIAAGVSQSSQSIALSPSGFLDLGFKLLGDNIWQGWKSAGLNLGNVLMYLIVIFLTVLSFFFMALQILLTKIEFNIFAALAVILMPFGIFRQTQFLFQRCVSAVFAFGIKLMVMTFMCGLVYTHVNDFTTMPDTAKEFSVMLRYALSYVVMGYLVWKIPNLVSGMMQGTPALDDHGAASTVGSYAMGFVRGKGGQSILGRGMSAAGSAYGRASSTLAAARATAGRNVSGVTLGPGNSMLPVKPTKLAVAKQFASNVGKQVWAGTDFTQGRIRGAQKSQYRTEDYHSLEGSKYKSNRQSNRNS